MWENQRRIRAPGLMSQYPRPLSWNFKRRVRLRGYHCKSTPSKASVCSQNEKERCGGSINLAAPSARPCTRATPVSGIMAVATWAGRASQVVDSPSFPLRCGVHLRRKRQSSPSSKPQGLLVAAKPGKTALRHSGIELALNSRRRRCRCKTQKMQMHEHQEISLADLPDAIATDSVHHSCGVWKTCTGEERERHALFQ